MNSSACVWCPLGQPVTDELLIELLRQDGHNAYVVVEKKLVCSPTFGNANQYQVEFY
jgi:hypothetical protein